MPSSVVDSFEYLPDRLILRVKFNSGLIYEYKNVPQEVYKSLKISGSKGRFLNFHIKGKYDFDRIN